MATTPERARQIAEQIATTTPAVALLGQVASSAAAGEVYKADRIPAITGAASEARVTKDNEWFFRLLSLRRRFAIAPRVSERRSGPISSSGRRKRLKPSASTISPRR